MNYTEKLLEVCDLHKVYTKDGVPTKALKGFHLMFSMVNIWVLWVQVVPVKLHY